MDIYASTVSLLFELFSHENRIANIINMTVGPGWLVIWINFLTQTKRSGTLFMGGGGELYLQKTYLSSLGKNCNFVKDLVTLAS